MSLARWIMDRAAANPPPGREAWARAMRAEFESLERGRLGWALGCWQAMASWKLRRDWLFLGVLGALAAVYPWTIIPPAVAGLALILPDPVFGAVFVPSTFALQVLPAVILAAWRPEHSRLAALVIPLVATTETVLMLHDMGGGWFERGWQYFNGPVLIGAVALTGACWVAAGFAAGVSRRLQSRRRFSAT
jgi:hypothetical protein